MEPKNIQELENIEIVPLDKVIYSGNVQVTGGRNGTAKSSDSRLDLILSAPGTKGHGSNPEQLLAAAWSSCFIETMRSIASELGIAMPAELSINASVDLGSSAEGLFLQARLHINLPALASSDAKRIVTLAHLACPYSRAVKNNINLQINVGV